MYMKQKQFDCHIERPHKEFQEPFFVVLGFEVKALHLQGRYFTTWSIHPCLQLLLPFILVNSEFPLKTSVTQFLHLERGEKLLVWNTLSLTFWWNIDGNDEHWEHESKSCVQNLEIDNRLENHSDYWNDGTVSSLLV
jgi:hypothetical protein